MCYTATMSDDQQQMATLYKTQISLSEWFEHIGHTQAAELREEDNWKRKRLGQVHAITGIPFDQPVSFPATEVVDASAAFNAYKELHGDDYCALRLIPTTLELPKLRMRGMTVNEVCANWLPTQTFDPALYQADFVPHMQQNKWSTIFIVNEYGIFGEIIAGGHHQLTQGFYEGSQPMSFHYNYQDFIVAPQDSDALNHLQTIITYLHIADASQQQQLADAVNATFEHNYLQGYFETVNDPDDVLWFIDYNRILGKDYKPAAPQHATDEQPLLSGQTGSAGIATGKARIVTLENIAATDFNKGDILVCEMTTPAYLPLMQKAAAVVTDVGGILSHAAITCRELGIPCVVATGEATTKLSSGDEVTVDANKGFVF